MLQKIKEVAAKLMTPRKSKAGLVVRVPRPVAFAACASVLFIVGCSMDLTGSSYQSRTQLQNRSIPSDDNYYAEENPVDELTRQGYHRALGYDGSVYCNGQDCLKFTDRKEVLGVGRKYYFHRVDQDGNRVGPDRVWGNRFGGEYQEYKP